VQLVRHQRTLYQSKLESTNFWTAVLGLATPLDGKASICRTNNNPNVIGGYRLWTEVLATFGPARQTNCFLSIGTGIPANNAIPKPGIFGSHDVEKGFAGVATNSEMVHILFRTLLHAYSPKQLQKKYWRLNVGQRVAEWDEEVNSWIFWKKKVKHLDNYKDLGELDDVGKLKALVEMTKEYIKAQDSTIKECADALALKL
jgi:hypothetical protein